MYFSYIHLCTQNWIHIQPTRKITDPSKAWSTWGATTGADAATEPTNAWANSSSSAPATGSWGAANDRANEIWQAPKVVGMRDHEIVNLI